MTNSIKQWANHIVCTASLLLVAGFANASTSEETANYNLMLMGSAPQICSSMNQDACESVDWIEANEMRTARLFNLSDVRRRQTMRQSVWPEERDEMRAELNEALETLADYFGYGVVNEKRLVERFRSRAHLDMLSRMSENEFHRVLDGLELPTLEGLVEHVNLDETKDASANLLRRYVELTAANSDSDGGPVVYVVTAAQRDPLGSLQSYQRALSAAGATVKWLPIDASVLEAQQNDACDSLDSLRRDVLGTYDRARVHADLHQQQMAFCTNKDAWQDAIAEADGVFFADGNQTLLRQAFFNRNGNATDLLNALVDEFNSGQLTIAAAGNSASAMSSAIMVTNGSSRQAMKEGSLSRPAPSVGCNQDDSCPRGVSPNSLTYHAMGGLAFYPFGLIDTEVSERGRQARMLRLAADTATPLATGIDRATALLVDTRSGEFEVQGDNGVLFVEQATGNQQMVGGAFHFLRDQSSGALRQNQVEDVQLAQQEGSRPSSVTTRFLDDTGVYDNIARLCEGRQKMELLQDEFVFLMQVSEATETLRAEGRCQVTNGTLGVARQAE
ncbi:hypothetical protein CWE12_09555 [Aliidiomarina sedimenti]|uniref:Cyanophycinase n=1 Tax=Aliidiomarina sedimenti TaxID=1933879 RepID=A0ABY0BXQ9_9GAMM|nr:hypothetical protein [Aliidiomarina sedimenti]RUO29221.1 hypothetical protein CWE12_09555 [Aliidiomarina sedimenti]